MSRESRFEKLESGIVDALRRAPGAEPSADLDARILARARAAVARPTRRPQPIWFSMAAGLVVLVGSGLALRIWQQVEHAPSALDAPPAASAPVAVREDESTAAPEGATGASSERAMPSREQTAPAASTAAKDAPKATPAGAELRRENIAEESAQQAPDLSAGPSTADAVVPSVAPLPKPFPAEPPRSPEPEPVIVLPDQPALAPSAEVMSVAPQVTAPAAPPPPPSAPAPTMQAAPATDVGAARAVTAAKAESAKARAAEGIIAPGRDADPFAQPELDGEGERQRAAPFDDQPIDPYAVALASVRTAIDAGDLVLARRLAVELRRDYPDRELPEDLRRLVERPR